MEDDGGASSGNTHKCNLRVDPNLTAPAVLARITSVRYDLHLTFPRSPIRVHEAPYAIGPLLGWGMFTVHVTVTIQDGSFLRGAHALVFDAAKQGEQVCSSAIDIPALLMNE